MTLTWYGGRCVLVEDRMRGQAPRSVLFFPETKTTRARTLEEKANVLAVGEGQQAVTERENAYVVHMPGEYDVSGFALRGTAFGEEGNAAALAYVLDTGDVTLGIIGGTSWKTGNDTDVAALGMIDVLVLPVDEASGKSSPISGLSDFIREAEPKIVVPLSHSENVRAAIRKELGVETETLSRCSLAQRDLPQEGFRVTFLDPQ